MSIMPHGKVIVGAMLFASGCLMTSPCPAQSGQFSAERVSIEGRLEKFEVMQQLPVRAQNDALGNFARPSFRSDLQQTQLKQAAEKNLRARVATAAVQSTTPPTSLASILTFSPPSTYDEKSCGNIRYGNGGLAVSASYLVEAGTACVKILNPATGAVISGPVSLSRFLGSSNQTSNVRALYDAVNGRFLVAAADNSSTNRIFLAVSESANPTQGWHIYSYPFQGTCTDGTGDNPKMGQTYLEPGDSEGAIYLSWEIDCPATGLTNFVGALSKTEIYSGTPVSTINGFQGLNVQGITVDGVQPANVMNPGDHPMGEFLLNSYNFHFGGGSCVDGCNGVVVWNFFNGIPASGDSQSLTAVEVATANTYYLPANAPQPGCGASPCGPGTGDTAINSEVTYSAGTLFGALNDGMGILIVELEPEVNDGAITGALMRNEICFACGGFSNGGQAYDGAIQPDSERNWAMVYNYSAPGTAGCTPNASTCVYPSAAFITKRVTQAQNTVDSNGGIFVLGQGYYDQVNPEGNNRWADYSAIGADYVLPNAFWLGAEFSESAGTWGSTVGETAYTSMTQP